MQKHITLDVDPEIDDFYQEHGWVRGRVYEVLGRMIKATENGSLKSPRAFSVRTGKAQMDLQGYYEKYRVGLGEWFLGVERVTAKHCNRVLSNLDRNLVGGKVPAEIWKLSERVGTNGFSMSVRVVFRYMEYQGADDFRGIEMGKWVSRLYHKADKVDRRRISDEEMIGLANGLKGDVGVWFRALAYSGMRLRQLLDGLKLLEKREEHEGFFKISIEEISVGSKGGEFIYLPMWLLPEVRVLDLSKGYNSLDGWLRHEGLPVKQMRKWNANFMRGEKIEADSRNFIHGRAPKTQEEDAYLNLEEHADEAYKELLPKFPDWLRKTEGDPGPGVPL